MAVLGEMRLWWLKKQIASKSQGRRISAISALGRLRLKGESQKHNRVITVLLGCLSDADEQVQRAAAEAFAGQEEAAAFERLLDALESSNTRACLTALGALGSSKAFEPLVRILVTFASEFLGATRRDAVKALGRLRDLRAIEPLTLSLGDSDAEVRRAAAEALRDLGEPRYCELVSGDGQDLTRICRCPGVEEFCLNAVRRPDLPQRAAMALLGKVGSPRAANALISALCDREKGIRAAAAAALADLGDRRWQTMSLTLNNIAATKDPRLLEPLIANLRDENDLLAADSASALGIFGDPRAVYPLLGALEDPRFCFKFNVAIALGELGDKRAIAGLQKVIQSTENLHDGGDTRRFAIGALEKLTGTQPSEVL